MRALFVGDRPSNKNFNPEVAFVGTKSYDTLKKWADKLGVEQFTAINRVHPDFEKSVNTALKYGIKIVALGNNASEALLKLQTSHFKLPHPSPKNRLLNNTQFVNLSLKKCKEYLHKAH